MLTSSSKLSDLNDESPGIVKNTKSEKKNINRKNNRLTDKDLKMEAKKSLNVNNFNNNKFSFAAEDNLNGVKDFKNKLDYKNYYDFKYLSQNRKIVKLLLYNNENVKSNQLFSDQIYYILNGNKKKKGVLLITPQFFYILDENNDLNYDLRITHKLLASISIPQGNFNHLLISFNDNSFVIIEIYRRIHLLNYLKELYSTKRNKKIDLYFCDNFNIKINNHTFIYEVNNNKNLTLTPNFENAQKMGLLKKYKENIFSGYFSDKLVVLCSLGLVVFSKSNINVPKLIIPIIGTISSGKSTFLDSFLGIELLQTGFLTTTKFVCIIKYCTKTSFYHVIPNRENYIVFNKQGEEISDKNEIKMKIEKINDNFDKKKATTKDDLFYRLETPIKNIKNIQLLENCYFMDIARLNEH
jgi:hypothetical protein